MAVTERLHPIALLLSCLALLSVFTCTVSQGTVCVSPTGADSGVCGGPSSPCCATLKHAVEVIAPSLLPSANASSSLSLHDIVVTLAPGVYGPDSCDVTVPVTMSIIGSGMDASVIDCGGQSRALQVLSPTVSVRVADVSVRGGVVTPGSVGGPGGGCVWVWWVDEDEGRVRSPVFELDGVRVSNCSVWSKGMDWLVGGGVGVLLSGNTATWGFSIKLSNSHILHNTINSPMGSDAIGGGFGLLLNSTQLTDASSVAIIDCVVANNSAFAGTSINDDGGGISYYYYGEGELRNASFLVDGYLATANFGGSMCIEVDGYIYSGTITVRNSVITNHTELGPGSGIYVNFLQNIVEWCSFHLINTTIANNIALPVGVSGSEIAISSVDASGNSTLSSITNYYGAGLFLAVLSNYFTGEIIISNTMFRNNSADQGGGGGLFLQYQPAIFGDGSIVIENSIFENNVAQGDGGGMLLWGKASIPINTSAYKQYRQWGYNVTVTIVNTTIHNNTAANSGNGGGIAVENSVPLTLVDSRITNNRASLYGGGVYMDATPNEIRFVGECALSGNSIPVGAGEQFASFSGGGVDFSGVSVGMSVGISQVMVQGGGEVVTANTSSVFQCPAGYLFQDVYRGLYGASASLMSEAGWANPMLTSTLLFECVACPPGLYAIGGGSSSGAAGTALNPTCYECPFGGVCTSGHAIVAAPGYWGYMLTASADATDSAGSAVSSEAAVFNATVVFLQCPSGYCCDGAITPCTAINTCAGNRVGRLCGSCPDGWGEVLASNTCRRESACIDGPVVWPLGVIVLLILGGLVLRNSDVWFPRIERPTGTVRLVSYYYQMVPLLVVSTSSSRSWATAFRQAVNSLVTLVRFQPPDVGSGAGYCFFPAMSSSQKVAVGYVMPVMIAVAMVVCLLASFPVSSWFGVNNSSVKRLLHTARSYVVAPAPLPTPGKEQRLGTRQSGLRKGTTVQVRANMSAGQQEEESDMDTAAESACSVRGGGASVAGAKISFRTDLGPQTVTSSSGDSQSESAQCDDPSVRATGGRLSQTAESAGDIFSNSRPDMMARGPRGSLLAGQSGACSHSPSASALSLSLTEAVTVVNDSALCLTPLQPQAAGASRRELGTPATDTASAGGRRGRMSVLSHTLSRVKLKMKRSFKPQRLILPLPDRMIGATLNWFLFTYSSVLAATFKLLLCIPFAGLPNTYLYLDANQECTAQWTAPLYIVMVCLLGFAVVLPILMRLKQKWAPRHPGVYRILTDPYRDECYWWECVLLVQRLVLSVLNTFMAHTPVLRMLLAGLVCTISAFLHLMYRPILDGPTQAIQTLFQFSLIMVVVVNVAVAQTVQNAQTATNPAIAAVNNNAAYAAQDTVDLVLVISIPVLVLCARVGLNCVAALAKRKTS